MDYSTASPNRSRQWRQCASYCGLEVAYCELKYAMPINCEDAGSQQDRRSKAHHPQDPAILLRYFVRLRMTLFYIYITYLLINSIADCYSAQTEYILPRFVFSDNRYLELKSSHDSFGERELYFAVPGWFWLYDPVARSPPAMILIYEMGMLLSWVQTNHGNLRRFRVEQWYKIQIYVSPQEVNKRLTQLYPHP